MSKTEVTYYKPTLEHTDSLYIRFTFLLNSTDLPNLKLPTTSFRWSKQTCLTVVGILTALPNEARRRGDAMCRSGGEEGGEHGQPRGAHMGRRQWGRLHHGAAQGAGHQRRAAVPGLRTTSACLRRSPHRGVRPAFASTSLKGTRAPKEDRALLRTFPASRCLPRLRLCPCF